MGWFTKEIIIHSEDKEIRKVIEWVNHVSKLSNKYINFSWSYDSYQKLEYILYIADNGSRRFNDIKSLMNILEPLEAFILLDTKVNLK